MGSGWDSPRSMRLEEAERLLLRRRRGAGLGAAVALVAASVRDVEGGLGGELLLGERVARARDLVALEGLLRLHLDEPVGDVLDEVLALGEAALVGLLLARVGGLLRRVLGSREALRHVRRERRGAAGLRRRRGERTGGSDEGEGGQEAGHGRRRVDGRRA